MSEMVKRAARAMEAATTHGSDINFRAALLLLGWPRDRVGELTELLARAAIEAMRETTEAERARLAGMAFEAIRMEERWPELFHRAWEAMIDEALK